MPLSLTLACLWVFSAALISMLPGVWHWRGAWALIAAGIPLLGYVTMQMGPWWGLGVMLAGASVLRWPLIRAGQRVRDALLPGPRD
jgi:hypothetical protein